MQNNECGLSIDIEPLMVCRVCGGVHGPAWQIVAAGTNERRDQACTCVTKTGSLECWPGYDFPTIVELCRCCGRAALRSGSRWSVWFCSLCKPRIDAVNKICRFGILPPGRHSLMAGVSHRAKSSDEDLPEFAQALQDWFVRIELLEQYAAGVVLQNLAILKTSDMAPDVPLIRYLEMLPRSDQVVAEATRALGRRAGVPEELLERALSRV